jgi:hypothetical protein
VLNERENLERISKKGERQEKYRSLVAILANCEMFSSGFCRSLSISIAIKSSLKKGY